MSTATLQAVSTIASANGGTTTTYNTATTKPKAEKGVLAMGFTTAGCAVLSLALFIGGFWLILTMFDFINPTAKPNALDGAGILSGLLIVVIAFGTSAGVAHEIVRLQNPALDDEPPDVTARRHGKVLIVGAVVAAAVGFFSFFPVFMSF